MMYKIELANFINFEYCIYVEKDDSRHEMFNHVEALNTDFLKVVSILLLDSCTSI